MKKIVSTLILSIFLIVYTCCSLESGGIKRRKTIGTLRSGITYEETQEEKLEFENLPPEILEDIISYLPQKDRIALAYATHNYKTIIDDYYEPARKIQITNKTLSSPQNFNNLLQYLKSHYITSIDLYNTNITDKTLNQILLKVGHSLRILNLFGCQKIKNPDFSHCQSLQKLYLGGLNIPDEAPNQILQKVGYNLRILHLRYYENLQNIKFDYCPQLQTLDISSCANQQNSNFCYYCQGLKKLSLSHTNITDEDLNQILLKVGHNLRILHLWGCQKLQNPNFCYCPQLQELNLAYTNITDKDLNQILQRVGRNLRILDLQGCQKLQNPDFSHCQNLQILDLHDCYNLQNINLDNCYNLKKLNLHLCHNLQKLNFYYCTQLQILDLQQCQNLQNRKAIESWARENHVEVRF